MLRMSKQADQALLLLSHIAAQEEGPQSARDVAAATDLPLPTVSKILKALARAGIVRSQRGVKGGYSLARAAERTSITEILAAMEGPFGVADCVPELMRTCRHEPTCPGRTPIQRLNGMIRATLDRVSLADLVGTKTHSTP